MTKLIIEARKFGTSMFLRMPDTGVVPILRQNGVKVPVDKDDVIK